MEGQPSPFDKFVGNRRHFSQLNNEHKDINQFTSKYQYEGEIKSILTKLNRVLMSIP